jgi:hypothetical protein
MHATKMISLLLESFFLKKNDCLVRKSPIILLTTNKNVT